MKKARSLVLTVLLMSSASALDDSAMIGRNEGDQTWLYYNFDISSIPSSNILTNIVKTTKALESSGTKVVIAVIPSKARIYSDHLPESLQLTSLASKRYDTIINTFKSNKIRFVDLNTAFLKAKVIPDTDNLFFRTDTHWTPRGNLVAATAISQEIRNYPEVKDSSKVSFSFTKVPLKWNADLPRFFNDSLKSQFPAEQYNDYQYTQTTGEQSLLGDEDIKITLVGTSFSGETLHFPQALEMKLERKVLAYAVPGGMVARTITEYLKSQTYKENKPKLIIWEIPEMVMWDGVPESWFEKEVLPNINKS